MRHSIRRWTAVLLGGVALVFCMRAQAGYTPGKGYTFNLGSEGFDATLGADMRIRLEGFERPAVDPDMVKMDQGPAYEYLRVRTRVWMGVKFQDWMKLNLRLVNRFQDYSSRPGDNGVGAASWEFPDEAIFDQMNLEFPNIADSDWSVTVGRQDFILGNGMVMLEGTPMDQGRTIYFDGVSAVLKKPDDTLKLFGFYNHYRDRYLVINDQERRLSRGDILTMGGDWTHAFLKPSKDSALSFNTELYYFYADVLDHPMAPEGDRDDGFHTAGLRLFGALHEQVDYSLEYAREFGMHTGEDVDLANSMIDARLTLKAPKDTLFSPSVLLEYTYLAGDDPASLEDNEGWDPIFAAYPIWREELVPTMLRGNWTNLHQPRIEGRLAVNKCWSVAVAYAYMLADQNDLPCVAGGGTGGTFGHLVSAFVDYKPCPYASFAIEVSEFYPGNYWTDADNSTWARFQTILSF